MLFGHSFLSESLVDNELSGIDLTPYVQIVAFDDISRSSSEQIKEFCESELAQVLQERQVLNKKAMMRLDKDADIKRRTKLIAYQLAKEANDPAWRKMCLYREKMKEQRAVIMKKYGKKAQKIALASQKEYIKTARKEPNRPVNASSSDNDTK